MGRPLVWSAIEPLVRAHRFKPQRQTNAYLVRTETTCVLNLQKSQWGDQFYVNCGVWFNRFGEQRQPKEYSCHIRWHVSSLAHGESEKLLVDALNLEKPLDESVRLARIADAVDRHGVAQLVRCDDEANALAMVSTFPSHAFLIRKELNWQGIGA